MNDIVYNVFPDEVKGLVSGRVLSASGIPVAGATVLIKDTAEPPLIATTDSKGMYAFYWDGFGDNSFRVSASYGTSASGESNVTVKLSNNSSIGNVWGVDLYLNKFVSCTVTFDAQGGTTPNPASKNVTYASPYGTLATSARTGYTFAGWWTGINGTGAQVLTTTVSTNTAAQTLYAKWMPISYALAVTCGSGGSNAYTNGQQVVIKANDPAVGAYFDRWTGAIQYVANAAAATTTVTMPAANIAVTANYKNILYALTVIGGSGSSTTCTNGQRVTIRATSSDRHTSLQHAVSF